MRSYFDTPRKGTQKQEWRWLQSKKSAHFRRALTRRFKVMFPNAHRASLRPFVRVIGKRKRAGEHFSGHEVLKHMDDIHPEVFGLLQKYGTSYRPFIWPKAAPETKRGDCVKNSWMLAHIASGDGKKKWGDRAPVIFVEGIVVGSIVRPMLHAWNARGLKSREAIDLTQYSVCRWSRYIGIPFTLEEHRELCLLTPLETKVQMLFWRKYFNDRVKAALISLLEKRIASR